MDWTEFTERLTRELMRLPANAYLIVQGPGGFPYVQAMRYLNGLDAEAVSSTFLPRPLAPDQERQLGALGWNSPDGDKRENWWRQVLVPAELDEVTDEQAADCGRLAGLMAAAFREVYGVRSPADLAYEANRNSVDGGPLMLPGLGLPRVGEAAGAAPAAEPGSLDWPEFTEQLAAELYGLDPQMVLVIHHRDRDSYYVQALRNADGVHAEAIGGQVLPPELRFELSVEERLATAGWQRPGTLPNWTFDLPSPATSADHRRLAELMVVALRDVQGAGTPGSLMYEAFWGTTFIELLDLGIGLRDQGQVNERRVRRPLPDDPPDATPAVPRRSAMCFAPTHADGRLITSLPPLNDPGEVERVRGFLTGGTPVLRGGYTADEVDPGKGEVVPVVYTTDGVWIWTAAQRYYLEKYGIPPNPAFYEHIVRQGYRAAEPDGAEVLGEAEDVVMSRAESAPLPEPSDPAPWLKAAAAPAVPAGASGGAEPDLETLLTDARERGDQQGYLELVRTSNLFVPSTGAGDTGRPATAAFNDGTYVLAFTSADAMDRSLRGQTVHYRRTAFSELARSWPRPEWQLAVNPGLPSAAFIDTATIQRLAQEPPTPAPTPPGHSPQPSPGAASPAHAAEPSRANSPHPGAGTPAGGAGTSPAHSPQPGAGTASAAGGVGPSPAHSPHPGVGTTSPARGPEPGPAHSPQPGAGAPASPTRGAEPSPAHSLQPGVGAAPSARDAEPGPAHSPQPGAGTPAGGAESNPAHAPHPGAGPALPARGAEPGPAYSPQAGAGTPASPAGHVGTSPAHSPSRNPAHSPEPSAGTPAGATGPNPAQSPQRGVGGGSPARGAEPGPAYSPQPGAGTPASPAGGAEPNPAHSSEPGVGASSARGAGSGSVYSAQTGGVAPPAVGVGRSNSGFAGGGEQGPPIPPMAPRPGPPAVARAAVAGGRPSAPSNVTVMQKVVQPRHLPHYLDGGYDRVAGYVHRVQDVAGLATPEQLVRRLGLTYEGSPYSAGDEAMHVIRWPVVKGSLFKTPYGGVDEAGMRVMPDGWVIEHPPFPGTGYAPGDGDAIPEFKIDSQKLPHGAELYRLTRAGEETLVAVYDADTCGWNKATGSTA